MCFKLPPGATEEDGAGSLVATKRYDRTSRVTGIVREHYQGEALVSPSSFFLSFLSFFSHTYSLGFPIYLRPYCASLDHLKPHAKAIRRRFHPLLSLFFRSDSFTTSMHFLFYSRVSRNRNTCHHDASTCNSSAFSASEGIFRVFFVNVVETNNFRNSGN